MTRSSDGGASDPVAGWIPPPPDEREEYEYDTPVGDPGDVLHFRQCWDLGGMMVDFAVIQMSPLGGRLRQVAYADIRHGELHVHILNQQGTEIGGEHLRPVVTQKTDAAASRAPQDPGRPARAPAQAVRRPAQGQRRPSESAETPGR